MNTPNKKTIKAMKELKNGKGIKVKSIKELFEKVDSYKSKPNLTIKLISNTKGKITAIQIPLNIGKKINSALLVKKIKIGMKEMKRIKKGKLKAKSLNELLNEN